MLEYGPIYLDNFELANRKKEFFEGYYSYFGGCILKMKGKEFWLFAILNG